MARLRFYLLAILAWFLIFYNAERLIAPINIASFVYALAAVYAMILILFAPIHRLSPALVFFGSLIPYFALKVVTVHPAGGADLPITVTEIFSIGLTFFLAWQIGVGLETLRREILRLTIGSAHLNAHPFQTAQAEFYREVRRARHYSRPLAVLSIAPTKESIDLSINRFLQEAQNNIVRQYIAVRTADFIRKTLKETDIVTMRNNHFLVLLPETETKHLQTLIQRIQNSAQEKLGLSLKIGASTFPDDALTFESLIHSAEERMKGDFSSNLEMASVQLKQTKPNGHLPNAEMNKADITS
jgi:GGDEF domain-containing protein